MILYQGLLQTAILFNHLLAQDDLESLRQAAEQGDAGVQSLLGLKYANGLGVPKDDAEAVRWYRLAAGQGHTDAQRLMGARYLGGCGVLKDLVLGHMWLNIASANGDEFASKARDTLEAMMTRAQLRRAIELARTCMDSDYQDCEP